MNFKCLLSALKLFCACYLIFFIALFLHMNCCRCSHVEIACYCLRPSNVTLWDLSEWVRGGYKIQQQRKGKRERETENRMQIGMYAAWHVYSHITHDGSAVWMLLSIFLQVSSFSQPYTPSTSPLPHNAPIRTIQLGAFRKTKKKVRNFLPPQCCLAWF